MPPFRIFTAVRAVILALILLAAASPASAQAPDAFTVGGIAVDATADSPLAAREKAFAEGQRAAWKQLVERLTAPGEAAKLPNLSNKDLLDLVRDVGVDGERTTASRYLATLTVRFKPDQVRRVFSQARVNFAEQRRSALMVLPVLVTEGGAVLWDDPNPWREAWANRGDGGLVPMIVPLGELETLAALNADQALAGDAERISKLAQRNGVEDSLVAVARLNRAGLRPQVDVKLSGFGPGAPRSTSSRNFAAGEGEDEQALLKRAAQAVAASIQEAYKRDNVLQFDRPATIAATVPVSGLADWLAVRDRLSRVPMVRSIDVLTLSRDRADVVLHYVGDQQQLETALAQNGLSLSWGDGTWQMRGTGRSSDAGLR